MLNVAGACYRYIIPTEYFMVHGVVVALSALKFPLPNHFYLCISKSRLGQEC